MTQPNLLSKAPVFFRAPIAKGLNPRENEAQIDRKGGDYGSGIIRGCAVITTGEALGHGLWVDETFVSQVSDAINASEKGVKMRFTHPDLSGDGLGSFLGRGKTSYLDGDVCRADTHLSKSSRKTPDGDLGGYVMDLAEDDPDAFGLSISFSHDPEAEVEFMQTHGGTLDPFSGEWIGFQSPDPLNVNNYPHCRLKELRAIDAVDTPAANPNGLFHKGQDIPAAAEKLLSFSLGLTKERPAQSVFDVDPDRLSGFVQRFLSRNGLSLQSKEGDMPTENETQGDAAPAEETAPVETVEQEVASETQESLPESPGETPVPAESSPKDPPASSAMSEGQKFLSAFGERGAVLFAQGKTFAEAQAIVLQETLSANAELQKKNAELQEQLKEGRGETPVTFQSEATPEQVKANKYTQHLGPNLGRFAAGLTVPNRN